MYSELYDISAQEGTSLGHAAQHQAQSRISDSRLPVRVAGPTEPHVPQPPSLIKPTRSISLDKTSNESSTHLSKLSSHGPCLEEKVQP